MKINLKKTCILGILIVAVTISSIFLNKYKNHKDITVKSSKETVRIQGDFPNYSTMEELMKESDIVIEGKILSNHLEKINISTTSYKFEQLYTVYDVEVLKEIKGNHKEGDIVKVKQLGDGKTVILNGLDQSNYFENSESIILFLKDFGVDSKVKPYSIISPIQGSLKVNNNRIESHKLNSIFCPIQRSGEIITKVDNKCKDNMSVDDFIQELRKIN